MIRTSTGSGKGLVYLLKSAELWGGVGWVGGWGEWWEILMSEDWFIKLGQRGQNRVLSLPDTSANAPLPAAAPSLLKGMSSWSSLYRTSVSPQMASQPPTGSCHEMPWKRRQPQVHGRMYSVVLSPTLTLRQELGPKSNYPLNLNPNLQRNQRSPLLPRQLQWPQVSVRGCKKVLKR